MKYFRECVKFVCFDIFRMTKKVKLSSFIHRPVDSTTISYFSLVNLETVVILWNFPRNSFLHLNHISQYRFATSWDWFMISLGVFASFLKAIPSIWTTIVYGELTGLLIDRTDGVGPSSSIVLLPWFGGGETLR